MQVPEAHNGRRQRRSEGDIKGEVPFFGEGAGTYTSSGDHRSISISAVLYEYPIGTEECCEYSLISCQKRGIGDGNRKGASVVDDDARSTMVLICPSLDIVRSGRKPSPLSLLSDTLFIIYSYVEYATYKEYHFPPRHLAFVPPAYPGTLSRP
jgi:hypothetical protein